MKNEMAGQPGYAVCVDNREYPASLELHKVYRLVQDAGAKRDGDLRVIDESGEDYVFPAECFVLIGLRQDDIEALEASYTTAAS